MVTHDPRVEEIADRVLWMEDGALRDRKAEPHSMATYPVCGMRVDEWTATLKSTYKNRCYVFCSEKCLHRFNENPVRYSHYE